jgi:RNA polymerase sigma factor (sigma-70 family)
MTDEELIAGYYGSNEQAAQQAFAELYQRHRNDLAKSLLAEFSRSGICDADAEEHAEVAFWRVVDTKVEGYGVYDSFRGASFRTWLRTIARRLVLDDLRGRAVRKRFQKEASESPPPPKPPDDLLRHELHMAANECFNALSERHRQVLQLAMDDKSHEEIAQELGITKGRSGSLRFEAKEQMRHCLEGRGWEDWEVRRLLP